MLTDILKDLTRRSPQLPFNEQEALCCLLFRKAGMHDGKMRKDILYSDFVLRESARQARLRPDG